MMSLLSLSPMNSVKRRVRYSVVYVSAIFALALFGCAEEPLEDPNAPVVLEVDQREIVVGESLYLYGKTSQRSPIAVTTFISMACSKMTKGEAKRSLPPSRH